MDRVRWGTGSVVLLGAALLLGGCGDVNKGDAKGADFERALTQRHGELIEDIDVGAENSLPWMGSFDARVTLRPTASMADLATVEAAADELIGDDADSAIVWANGVEMCKEGAGPRTQHLALREGLRASSASLTGELACEKGYAGELGDLSADIAVVQSVIAGAPGLEDLRVDARISAPSGEVSGRWADLPARLAEVLRLVDPADLNSFDLTGSTLEIGVQPGLDESRVRSAAAALAPGVTVTLAPGPASGGSTALPPRAAELRAAVGSLPGVESVRYASSRQLVVRVASPTDVAPTVAAGRPLALDTASLDLHVTTQASDAPAWTVRSGADFEVDAAAEPEHLEDFAALVADGTFSAVGWREGPVGGGAPMVTITAPAGGDLREVLPLVKQHVPVGADLNLHLGDENHYFDVAPQLEPGSGDIDDLPRTFVETWNSLP